MVSARRIIGGILTGNPEQPVIPCGPDAVRIEVVARPQGLRVTSEGSENTLTLLTGTLAFAAEPRLAEGVENPGVYAVATPIIPLSDGPMEIVIEKARFEHFRVATSDAPEALTQISGAMRGRVSPRTARSAVNGACSVPTDGAGLNPDYDPATFAEKFSCRPNLQLRPIPRRRTASASRPSARAASR